MEELLVKILVEIVFQKRSIRIALHIIDFFLMENCVGTAVTNVHLHKRTELAI